MYLPTLGSHPRFRCRWHSGWRSALSWSPLESESCFLDVVYIRTYIMTDFQWDPKKALANLAKHAVDFSDASEVLFYSMAITVSDLEQDEERFVTIGTDALSRILVVVYTWRGDRIRIISARRATRLERKQYEEPA